MGFLSRLFTKGEAPLPIFEHPILSRSEWSEDDEAWAGEYNGFEYLLAYERTAVPAEELTQYAVEMLGKRQDLLDSVEGAKTRAAREHTASFCDEISRLKLSRVHFYRHKNRRCILADLKGGLEYRAWRIEYHDHTCVGIGFDS